MSLEPGGKSPNTFFDDVAGARDEFCDESQEGFTLFALNSGEDSPAASCPAATTPPRRVRG